ncbi:hypothetical protein SAMN04487993_1003133 [Salipiger marinus]|uniref:Uncharacterized protein n=2 Tax=Salipiger marinus TaxID=555512 RepID=A0A1G8JLP5_9RHOB|nr:hypothetical protein SAMN04487993_1003133 [Salipiger marinus]
MGEGMSAELNNMSDLSQAALVEQPHWAPPEAPLEMPEQVVETEVQPAAWLHDWVQRVLLPRQRI